MPQPIRTKDGRWKIDCREKGVRVRKQGFPTAASARRWLRSQITGDSEPTLPDQIEEYLTYSERMGKRASTLRSDRQRLTIFAGWAAKADVTDVSEIDAASMRQWMDYYFENAPFTVRYHRKQTNPRATWEKYRQNLSAFFNWCVQRGMMDLSPLAGKPGKEFRTRQQKKLPRVLSQDESTAILGFFDSLGSTMISTFFRLLLYTGMRLGEALQLEWSDIDARRVLVQHRTKSRKPRSIPLAANLGAWLRQLRDETPDHTLVFENGSRGPAYSETYWWQLLRKATDHLKIPPARLHDLRHTFGAELARRNVHIRTIQLLMGHEDINSTLIYLNFQPEHFQEAIASLDFESTLTNLVDQDKPS